MYPLFQTVRQTTGNALLRTENSRVHLDEIGGHTRRIKSLGKVSPHCNLLILLLGLWFESLLLHHGAIQTVKSQVLVWPPPFLVHTHVPPVYLFAC
jgi:hypothetical protein